MTDYCRWPYKFVHALLRLVAQKGNLNLQSNTPVAEVSKRDVDGWITVKMARGNVRTKTVMHATNRWAPHLLSDFETLIFPSRGAIAAIKAPEGFIRNPGAQHWDDVVNVSALLVCNNGLRTLTMTELPPSTASTIQYHHSWRWQARTRTQPIQLHAQ